MGGFKFDPHESTANRAKHGIDLIEAQHLWDNSYRIEIYES
jgi:uncharacterized DUF497 family protein